MSYRGDSRTLKSKMEEKNASNSGAGSLPILLCHGKGIYKFIIVHVLRKDKVCLVLYIKGWKLGFKMLGSDNGDLV